MRLKVDTPRPGLSGSDQEVLRAGRAAQQEAELQGGSSLLPPAGQH